MIVRTLVLALIAAALAVPAARADGDPASDVLYTADLYLPPEAPAPAALEQSLVETVKSARDSGYRIKVALIGSQIDLGAVGGLWLRPQRYARFLAQELSFLYHGRLLIVMPNGFGFVVDARTDPHGLRALKRVPVAPGSGLVQTAIDAVRALAAADGHALPAVKVSHRSPNRDRLKLGGAVLVALLLLAAGAVVRRVRARRPG